MLGINTHRNRSDTTGYYSGTILGLLISIHKETLLAVEFPSKRY